MSAQLVAVSFFNSKKIDHYIYQGVIVFPCFNCLSQAKMKADNSNWNCEHCKAKGNLFSLVKLIEESEGEQLSSTRLYNPAVEVKIINVALNKLIKKKDNDLKDTLIYTHDKFRKLVNYLGLPL